MKIEILVINKTIVIKEKTLALCEKNVYNM